MRSSHSMPKAMVSTRERQRRAGWTTVRIHPCGAGRALLIVLLIDVKAASADEPQLVKALGYCYGWDIITDHDGCAVLLKVPHSKMEGDWLNAQHTYYVPCVTDTSKKVLQFTCWPLLLMVGRTPRNATGR